eukprot:TRINITY_DN8553_c0_g1_i1.p1 TRINITY_DN8553_c0_g1~~TRINITY_DN8553_c0_g1_i1.p1  ORF type:complete len:993 (+),score=117.09 TRINITY_DN8553_c0_g1_i1:74-3052(+)
MAESVISIGTYADNHVRSYQPPPAKTEPLLIGCVLAICWVCWGFGIFLPIVELRPFPHLIGASLGSLDVGEHKIKSSTLGTLRLLYSGGFHLAFGILSVCSVLVPFLKLSAMTVASLMDLFRPSGRLAWLDTTLRALTDVASYQLMDLFVGLLVVAFLDTDCISAQLQVGFSLFALYCVLSQAMILQLTNGREVGVTFADLEAATPPSRASAASPFETPVEPSTRLGETDFRFMGDNESIRTVSARKLDRKTAWTNGATLLLLIIIGACQPMLDTAVTINGIALCRTRLRLDEIAYRAATGAFLGKVIVAVIAISVAVIPLAAAVCAFNGWSRSTAMLTPWIMTDVFALSLITFVFTVQTDHIQTLVPNGTLFGMESYAISEWFSGFYVGLGLGAAGFSLKWHLFQIEEREDAACIEMSRHAADHVFDCAVISNCHTGESQVEPAAEDSAYLPIPLCEEDTHVTPLSAAECNDHSVCGLENDLDDATRKEIAQVSDDMDGDKGVLPAVPKAAATPPSTVPTKTETDMAIMEGAKSPCSLHDADRGAESAAARTDAILEDGIGLPCGIEGDAGSASTVEAPQVCISAASQAESDRVDAGGEPVDTLVVTLKRTASSTSVPIESEAKATAGIPHDERSPAIAQEPPFILDEATDVLSAGASMETSSVEVERLLETDTTVSSQVGKPANKSEATSSVLPSSPPFADGVHPLGTVATPTANIRSPRKKGSRIGRLMRNPIIRVKAAAWIIWAICYFFVRPPAKLSFMRVKHALDAIGPLINVAVRNSLPAAIGDCNGDGVNAAKLPPTPCIGDAPLYSGRSGSFHVLVRWASGINTIRFTSFSVSMIADSKRPLQIAVGGHIESLKMSMQIESCFLVGCATLWDNADGCCQPNRTFELIIGTDCVDDPSRGATLVSFKVEWFNIDDITLKETILGAPSDVADLTPHVRNSVRDSISSFLSGSLLFMNLTFVQVVTALWEANTAGTPTTCDALYGDM